ncbi:TPM domain-containing protein [Spirosoma areae]
MRQNVTRLLVLVLLVSGWITPVIGQPYTPETVPNPKQSRSSHYVSNPDHILSSAAVSQIDSLLGRLEDSTTAQVAVVCLNSIGERVPKEFATALFRKWGLGYRQKNNGLLILLVKDQHRIEMETGYGLEGILPDAICSRIQTQKMVPLAKTGNFDGAMIDGVEEIARLISKPEAAKEVYDESKYTANQPLDNYGIFVLFLLLIPCLFVLRVITFFVKKSNPIAGQIEKTVSQSKGRWAWAFLLYIVMPVCVGLVVIQLRQPLSLHGWQILLVMYAYTGTVVWDARRRRKNTFMKLYGTMTEPQRYVRQKAAGLNGWGNVLLFPIPFGWLKSQDDQAVNALRNHSRKSAEGIELTKVDGTGKDDFLTDYQRIEQRLASVDYDVWRNETYNIVQAIGYENLSNTVYQYCTKCNSKAMSLTNNRIIKEATTEREGRGSHEYACQACGRQSETQYTIAILRQRKASTSHSTATQSATTYSSSGSSSWGSSSSSSSSSSWGGGSSGGGGAGSSW